MIEIPIVLIGHKDHGKSTLIGRLILDSGSIKESRVKEVKEVDEAFDQKFELAHLVDSFKEEREREMTMDTTRVVLKGEKRNYQLIDVPGHSELISNMLTGAAGAEGTLLLVDIEEGIKEQTHQHLEIAKLLGIEQLGVVINKMDKVGYQKDAFRKMVENLKEVLNKIGYSSENIHFFPISAWEGDNVIKKSENTPWYQGPTLMEFLENEIREPESFENLPIVYLTLQDGYSDGDNTILIGKTEEGTLKIDQEFLFANNKKFKVIKIKDQEGELNIGEVKAGQNFGIEVSGEGLVMSDIRGTAMVRPINQEVNEFLSGKILSGEIFWIEKPSQDSLILERGADRVEAKLLEPDLTLINQREKTSYKISLKKEIFKPKSKTILGKIVLKDKGKIIAVGNIK